MTPAIIDSKESRHPHEDARIERVNTSDSGPVLGHWYWVKEIEKGVESEWLGCAMNVGSNFVELHSPHSRDFGHNHERVHLKDFWTRLRHAPDADVIIKNNIQQSQLEGAQLMEQVQELTAELGMRQHDQTSSESSPNALMVLSGSRDVKAYGNDLLVAKTETLPALFKAIEHSTKVMAKWMGAPTMPMMAAVGQMKEGISDIDDRIFSVRLYAGLTEEVVQCCQGKAASANDRLHVMQRMTYMDEECLANYRHGGMEFKDIEAFDQFMCEPENRDSILPFPRALVAMQVRRNSKSRTSGGSLRTALINMRLEAADKLTFLYIRNGEQVWRLSCDFQFESMIFPERAAFNPLEPKMVKVECGRVRSFITVSDYEQQLIEHENQLKKQAAWIQANPEKNNIFFDMPWELRSDFRPDNWTPVDQTNVYFDECMEKIDSKMKEYNRVALIIQGMFDRSAVLNPHPPVQTWSAEGFEKAVKLVYDGSDVIAHGEPPDFEAYRARCNAGLQIGSVTSGQDDFWATKEAEKGSKRLDNDRRNTSSYRPEKFRPYGNPGPGYTARVWKLTKKFATFHWSRAAHWDKKVNCILVVPIEQIFNIDAYKPGDYKQFFADSRTREQYLKWAPLLLEAEEYHAKKLSKKGY